MANNYHDWTEDELDEYEKDLERAVQTAQKELERFRQFRRGTGQKAAREPQQAPA